MKKVYQRFTSLTVIFLILLSGCATTGGSQANDKLVGTNYMKFEDVPVPEGFKPVIKESFTFQNDYSRIGVLKYRGKARTDKVVDFYREQMALYGWNLINIVEYERRILNYDKPKESCIITVEASITHTTIIINLAPKSQKKANSKPKSLKKLLEKNP